MPFIGLCRVAEKIEERAEGSCGRCGFNVAGTTAKEQKKEMSCIWEINSMLTGIIMEYTLHKFSLFIDLRVPFTAAHLSL